jgi:hypothetical protein
MADEKGFYDIWPGSRYYPAGSGSNGDWAHWRKEMVDYFNRYHDDEYLYRQYLLNIILLQNFFKANNKRYLMLDSFGNNRFDSRLAGYNQPLVDQIDGTCYIGWPESETMMEWTYGCDLGPGGHFLEEGHIRVAEKIYQHMEQLSWLS